MLKNRDKFYGLADSILSSIFRFGCGIAVARFGTTDEFAGYILLITAAVIFQTLPNTSRLIPLLNRGTGAAPQQYEHLCIWAQRGVERAALVFILVGAVVLFTWPQLPINYLTCIGFLIAVAAQLWQQYYRTRLQLEFNQKHAVIATSISSCIHLFATAFIWQQGISLLAAFWWGAYLAALTNGYYMRQHCKKIKKIRHLERTQYIQQAQTDGLHMLRGSIANSVCSRIQPFLLSIIVSTQAIAFYGALWTLIGPLRLFSIAITNLLRPRLALFHNNNQPHQFQRFYRSAILSITTFGIIACILAALFGTTIVQTFFGLDLAPAGTWLSLALLYATLDAMTTSQMIALQIKHPEGPRLSSKLRINAATISLLLVIPASYTLGIAGTFLSLILAESYYAISCYRITYKHKTNYENLPEAATI